MPTYEYGCTECGRRLEVLQRLDEPPLTTCPHCRGPLKKLVSAPAFQFKGKGWYVTDYARKSGGGSGAAETGDSAPAAAKETASAPADGGAEKPEPTAPPPKPAPKTSTDS